MCLRTWCGQRFGRAVETPKKLLLFCGRHHRPRRSRTERPPWRAAWARRARSFSRRSAFFFLPSLFLPFQTLGIPWATTCMVLGNVPYQFMHREDISLSCVSSGGRGLSSPVLVSWPQVQTRVSLFSLVDHISFSRYTPGTSFVLSHYPSFHLSLNIQPLI